MRDINIRIFEQRARDYDAWFEVNSYAYESEVLALRSLLPRGGTGLEVGVGTRGVLQSPSASKSGWSPHMRWQKSHGNEA